jgi:hypothetical protein
VSAREQIAKLITASELQEVEKAYARQELMQEQKKQGTDIKDQKNPQKTTDSSS